MPHQSLKDAAFEALEGEFGGVGDGHHGHDAGLHGVGDHQVGGVGNTAGHVQADDQKALAADFADGHFDFSAHQRSGQHQRFGAWQPGHGADGIGQFLFAHQRDGVHRNVFAADVVAVGFGDGADGYLAHLRAATHDDDALAVDGLESLDDLDAAHDGKGPQALDQRAGVSRQNDFEVGASFFSPGGQNIDGSNIALVPGNHAGHLVQHASGSDC